MADIDRRAPEILHHNRKIHHRWRFLIDSVIAIVAHNADDFTPWRFTIFADSLANGGHGILPILPREILRNQYQIRLVVDVRPGKIAPSQNRVADGVKVTRSRKFEPPD